MQVDHIRNDFVQIPSSTSVQEEGSFSVAEGVNFGFSRTFDEVGRFPAWNDREFPGKRRPVCRVAAPHHRKCGRTEKEARDVIKTAPGVGFVTAEVVLSELGDISRFRNAKAVCAYAGLVPTVRQSGEKRSKDLRITKEGSGLLRWALVESAWRLVGSNVKWSALFARLKKRSGKKRAIVAVARKLLCVLYAMLKTSTPYKPMMAA